MKESESRPVVIDLNRGWQFCPGEAKRYRTVTHEVCYDMTKAGHELGEMDVFLGENQWQAVDLPHDWCAQMPADPEGIANNGYKKRGVGWYYLRFQAPAFGDEESALLEFEGVMGDCLVYVNGARALRNHSGYNGFYADVAAYLKPGEENTLAVYVDARAWEGWWYEGAGIYRPVALTVRAPLRFRHLSAFAAPALREGRWQVDLSATLENGAESKRAYRARALLLDGAGGQIAACDLGAGRVAALGEADLKGCLEPGPVALWSPDAPNLYTVALELCDERGETVDQQRLRCGFREIAFTSDRGMLLNGVPLRVNGICCHQDHAGVGVAVSKSIVRYRIQKLKEMGCNAYRCAHHMPWTYLLEVCDEAGMLVMDENRHFNAMEETLLQVDDMVLRARNHPCVFLYSLFNEEYWQSERRGYLIARALARRVRRLDATRPVTAAMNGGVLTEKNAADATDVAGMNYFIDDYMNFARRCPGKPLVGTENGPIFATRGECRTDAARQVYDGYGDHTSPFGQLLEDSIEAAEAAPHAAGLFMWGGFDYRGEPYPFTWPSAFSHWGFCDVCGLRKDTSYLLQSYYGSEPVAHLLPHWNHEAGEAVRVCAFTNAETAALFLNGRPLGELKVARRRAEWMVPFEPGQLRVVARMADGQTIADSVRTAGAPAALALHQASPAGADCAIVDIRLVDGQGTTVPLDDRIVEIQVEGGHLLGAGNGDPNAAALPDCASRLPTFHGQCQVLLRPEGRCRLVLRVEGLPDAELWIA